MSNKTELSENSIYTHFIISALINAGWDLQKQIREEVYFTDGRIQINGKKNTLALGSRQLTKPYQYPGTTSDRTQTPRRTIDAGGFKKSIYRIRLAIRFNSMVTVNNQVTSLVETRCARLYIYKELTTTNSINSLPVSSNMNFIVLIFFIAFSEIVYAGQWGGVSQNYQLNQIYQLNQNINQQNQINQNIIQMDQLNQIIQMNQMEQMHQNINQRIQINQDLNQINQMNQMLNMQQQIEKQKKKAAISPIKKSKQKH
jgi:hypothetical protein